MSWSNVRKAPKKRKHKDRYFTQYQELSKTVEENTSATTGGTVAAANENRLKVNVVIITYH
jgi:hypothetical protein